MKFKNFLEKFDRGPEQFGPKAAQDWLVSKVVFNEDEVYNKLQTAAG
jgi:hypothetical protein